MNTQDLFSLIGEINDTWIIEAEELSSPASSSAPSDPRSWKRFFPSFGLLAASILLVTGIFLIPKFLKKETSSPTSDLGQEETVPAILPVTENLEETTLEETIPENFSGGPGSQDGNGNGIAIPPIPSDHTICYEGKSLTEKEAAAYFSENLPRIISSLKASGLSLSDPRISETGYSHVCYGNEADHGNLVLNRNFRDYPLFDGENLVAIVTLFKIEEDDLIHDSVSFGGEWFSSFGDFLRAHQGEKLLFIYINRFYEIILTPDGKCYSPQGNEISKVSESFSGISDPYSILYCEEAVYTP